MNTSLGVSSELTLSGVRREDGKSPYTCSAANLCNNSSMGNLGCKKDERSVWLFILGEEKVPKSQDRIGVCSIA